MKAALCVSCLVGGCLGGGDDAPPDPPDDPPVVDGALPPATSLFTGVQAVVTDGDAKLWLILRDDATGEAVLTTRDVRFDTDEELDRMPFGDGLPQIIHGRQGIVWGFGGTPPAGGTFRYVTDTGAQSLDFTTHTPNVLLGQHVDNVLYASVGACTTENLDLTSGAFDVRAGNCYAQFDSVVQDDILGIWLRVSDDVSTSIGMMDGLWFGEISYAKTGMSHPIGPFISPNTYWFVDNTEGARVYTGATHIWPVPEPQQFAHLPGIVVDAGATLDDDLWGATRGTPSYLYPISSTGLTIRYPVTYRPALMFGIHDRLIILLDDDRLLDQPIPPAA